MDPINPGKLWLLPVPIGDEMPSTEQCNVAKSCQIFIVEKGKIARQWLKKMDPAFTDRVPSFLELNKHGATDQLKETLSLAKKGYHIALMSDAGCPGVADPGSEVVYLAHRMNIEVRPIVGANSLILSLMACGFDTQRFYFKYYLPVKQAELKKELKALEQFSAKELTSIVFIETPYRNLSLLKVLLETLHDDTQLCVAAGLQTNHQTIKSMSICEWKNQSLLKLDKIPCVFILCSSRHRQT